MMILSFFFIIITIAVQNALSKQSDFPMAVPNMPKLASIYPPPKTETYPEINRLFNDNEIIRIDFTTDTPIKPETKESVRGTITISTLTGNTTRNMEVRLAGGDSLFVKHEAKNFYFKTLKGEEDFFGEWDRFSVKKSLSDPTLCSEKFASDISIAIGYYPRHVSYASVTANGVYVGIYTLMQRMRKQWIRRTYGPNTLKKNGKKKKIGSMYKADDATLKSINNQTDLLNSNLFLIKNTNKKQNKHPSGTGIEKGKDLKEFAFIINFLASKQSLTEVEKELLRNTIDYENYARAHVLDFYSGDDDGYFIGQRHNYEWYHDIVDGLWKLLRWDVDSGFRYPDRKDFYTLAPVPVQALKALLKDEKYKELYETILYKTAQTTLPAYDGQGERPAYFSRCEIMWKLVDRYETPLRKTLNSVDPIRSIEDLNGNEGGPLKTISDSSRLVIEKLKSKFENQF